MTETEDGATTMPKSTREETQIRRQLRLLIASRNSPLEQQLDLLELARGGSKQSARRFDELLLGELARLRGSVEVAKCEIAELIAGMNRIPWYPALVLRLAATSIGERALVRINGGSRLVDFADGLDRSGIGVGSWVYLDAELSRVMSGVCEQFPRCGETVRFEARISDERLLVRARDEQTIVSAAADLDVGALSRGDRLRCDLGARMAFERVDDMAGRSFLLEQVPDLDGACVGGSDESLEMLISALSAQVVNPALAERFGVGGRRSVLMHGPPGCGKTLRARVAVSAISKLSGRRAQFAIVSPGQFESPYVGETAANIRHCFQSLREASRNGPAVLFLDEIEAIGRIRGGRGSVHSDRFLGALLAEIDGFDRRGDVAVIAATNRKDLLDPALLQRISAVEIPVPRPDQRAARSIFEIHLPASLPFEATGSEPEALRAEIVESAVSTLYSPNGQGELCTLFLRDGQTRGISIRDLMSGRLIEQICRDARHRAWSRALHGAATGIGMRDVEEALCAAIERLGSTLSPTNAQAHVADLPQDVDVVRVEPRRRNARRTYRYVNVADSNAA